jgi:hypothetical protein
MIPKFTYQVICKHYDGGTVTRTLFAKLRLAKAFQKECMSAGFVAVLSGYGPPSQKAPWHIEGELGTQLVNADDRMLGQMATHELAQLVVQLVNAAQ